MFFIIPPLPLPMRIRFPLSSLFSLDSWPRIPAASTVEKEAAMHAAMAKSARKFLLEKMDIIFVVVVEVVVALFRSS